MTPRPWHGVLVANPMFFSAQMELDLDRYAEHIGWLAQNGCHGITPNGSLGEYQTLTEAERRRVVEVAVEAAPSGFAVIPGVGAYGARESVRLTEEAALAGAQAVMALPPNAYRADRASVLAHYRAIAAVGLPVVAYNNPFDTKVDLTPDLLAELAGAGLIAAVKEFAGDPRRAYMITEISPDLDVLIGSDDTVLEVALAGASGWVSGYTNAFPRSCVELYNASIAGDVVTAVPIYRALHPLLRWDSKPEFVQAIKASMDVVGRHGGACRPPRGPLDDDTAALIRGLTEKAIAAGVS